MKRKRMILMVMLMKMVSMISMISMILLQTMVWASMRVIVVIVVRTHVCMLLLMMLALVFSHPTRHETMKLLLASATSLVTRVAYGRLENCQAQRANQASDSSDESFSFQLPRAGAGWAASASCWHSTSTAPELALDGRLPLPVGMNDILEPE